MGAIVSGARGCGCPTRPNRSHLDAARQQVRLEPAVEVGPVHASTGVAEESERGWRGVAVVVAGTD